MVVFVRLHSVLNHSLPLKGLRFCTGPSQIYTFLYFLLGFIYTCETSKFEIVRNALCCVA